MLENSAVCMYMSFYFLSIAPIEQNIIIYYTTKFFQKSTPIFFNSLYHYNRDYSTAYKLCALVDTHKTLIVLCCVPYLQLSGSHAFTIVLRLPAYGQNS